MNTSTNLLRAKPFATAVEAVLVKNGVDLGSPVADLCIEAAESCDTLRRQLVASAADLARQCSQFAEAVELGAPSHSTPATTSTVADVTIYGVKYQAAYEHLRLSVHGVFGQTMAKEMAAELDVQFAAMKAMKAAAK